MARKVLSSRHEPKNRSRESSESLFLFGFSLQRSVIAGHGTLTSATSVAYPTSFCYRAYINSYLADAWAPNNSLAMICVRPLSLVPSLAARPSLPYFPLHFSFPLAPVPPLLHIQSFSSHHSLHTFY